MKVKIQVYAKNYIVYQEYTTDTLMKEFDEINRLRSIHFVEEKNNELVLIDYSEEKGKYTKVDYLEIDNEKLDLKSDYSERAGREGYFILGTGIKKDVGVN